MEGISVSAAGAQKEDLHQFSWSLQGSRVLEQLRALYLSTDQEGSAGDAFGIQPDVVLFSGDGDFVEAHKLVLSLCSPYFQELFLKISRAKSEKVRNEASVVVLNNLNSNQLKHLIRFMYSGEVAVCSDQIQGFLEAGRAFQMDGIIPGTSASSAEPSSISLVANGEEPVPTGATTTNEDFLPSATQTRMPDGDPHSFLDELVDESYGPYPEVKMELEEDAVVQGSSTFSAQDPLASDYDEEDEKNASGGSPVEGPASIPLTSKRRRREVTETPSRMDGWAVQDPLPEETLKQDWRIYQKFTRKTYWTTTFYCKAGGQKCPAKLRKIVQKNDSAVTWLNNQVEHNFHPDKDQSN